MSAVDRVAVAEIPEPTQVFVVSNLLVCSMLWATGLLFIKLSGDINPFVIAAMRGLIGATSLVLWFAVLRKAIVPTKRDWPTWLFLGTFNGWLPNVLVAFALTQITTASAAMIQASSPLIVALLSHLCFAEEKLTPRRLGGVLVGFVGMGILIGPAAFPNSGVGGAGALAMVATAISYAIANVFVRTVRHADPARLALGQQFCSAVPATILALALSGPAAFASCGRSSAAADRPRGGVDRHAHSAVHAVDPTRGPDAGLHGRLSDAALDRDPRRAVPERAYRPARNDRRRCRAGRRGAGVVQRPAAGFSSVNSSIASTFSG